MLTTDHTVFTYTLFLMYVHIDIVHAVMLNTPSYHTGSCTREDNRRSSDQTDCEIEEKDIPYLAKHFDNVELYLMVFELTTAEQADVKIIVHVHGNQEAMAKCLSLWRKHNPSTATLRALLDILLRLGREEIATKVCDYYHPKHKP